VGTQVDVAGRTVLEVGCGRGGGASYVKRYLGPSSMVGMDLADSAVEFCRQRHRLEGLRFVQGDAERIPFDDGQFDVVINVESSHCYPDVDAFFREVSRVLRPGGHFLYADVMPSEELPKRRKMLNQLGLQILQERDITSNVLASLDSSTDQRLAFEENLASVFGLAGAREWAIVPGSMTLDGMRAGTLCYVSMTLRAGQPSVQA
jgi:SAM-dependent methyltransferase